MFEIPR
jgi:hypothetical protein